MEKYVHKKRGVPITHEYLYRRRKTRPRLGEPLVQELAAYSQDIVQMAERREGSSMNRIKQSSPLQPEHPFARSPKAIRGAEANDIIEATIVRDIPGARLNATLLKDHAPVIVMQAPPLHAPTLRKLDKEELIGKIGWEDAFRKLGWCMVCTAAWWCVGMKVCGHMSFTAFRCHTTNSPASPHRGRTPSRASTWCSAAWCMLLGGREAPSTVE